MNELILGCITGANCTNDTSDCLNNNPIIEHLLTLTTALVSNATTIFNMFLTVVFGSFAFAATVSLRNIGRLINFKIFKLSTSSIWMGGSLLAFYVISFQSFNSSVKLAIASVKDIQQRLDFCGEKTQIFKLIFSDEWTLLGLQLPSLGFIIGSATGLGIFLWISNIDKEKVNLSR